MEGVFVSAVIMVGLLLLFYFALSRLFHSRDKQEDAITKAIKERDVEREKASMQWREVYVGNQRHISEQVEEILKSLNGKLDKKEHAEICQTEEIWGRLNKHCHDAQGNVVIPRG